MVIDLYQVDAFTTGDNDLFTGNPAAVCLLQNDDDISDEIKQKIASEMNLSETAFVAKQWTSKESDTNNLDGNISRFNITEDTNALNKYTLRWFTPTNEVEFCGHATLASAKVLFDTNANFDKVVFETKFKGDLAALVNRHTNLITLDLPKIEVLSLTKEDHSWIDEIITNTLGNSLSLDIVDEVCAPRGDTTNYFLIALKSSDKTQILNVNPNFDKLLRIDTNGVVSGVIVTQSANIDRDGAHFFSRFFSSWNGIDEDPVTGSAHCILTPYWRKRLGIDGQLIGKQCSKRGGLLYCSQIADRIHLSGNARILIKANLLI